MTTPSRARAAVMAAAVVASGFTLAACYGGPPQPNATARPTIEAPAQHPPPAQPPAAQPPAAQPPAGSAPTTQIAQ